MRRAVRPRRPLPRGPRGGTCGGVHDQHRGRTVAERLPPRPFQAGGTADVLQPRALRGVVQEHVLPRPAPLWVELSGGVLRGQVRGIGQGAGGSHGPVQVVFGARHRRLRRGGDREGVDQTPPRLVGVVERGPQPAHPGGGRRGTRRAGGAGRRVRGRWRRARGEGAEGRRDVHGGATGGREGTRHHAGDAGKRRGRENVRAGVAAPRRSRGERGRHAAPSATNGVRHRSRLIVAVDGRGARRRHRHAGGGGRRWDARADACCA